MRIPFSASTVERGELRHGEALIRYKVVRSHKRTKTMLITLDPKEGVVVTVPHRAPSQAVRDLVEKRASWILRTSEKVAARPPPKQLKTGETLPYMGREIPLVVESRDVPRRVTAALVSQPPFGGEWAPVPRANRSNGHSPVARPANEMFLVTVPRSLTVDQRREAIQAVMGKWYAQRAAEWLPGRVAHWSAVGGYSPGAVLIRSQRRRWASCAQDGTLRFNWRIMLAEPAVIDCVVVHELAHLRIKNHSTKFWEEVARVMPDHAVHRQRLRELEPALEI